MNDATAKLSELLSAVRGRRTLEDALGFLRREPSTKTRLSTTYASAHPSANSFLDVLDGSRSTFDPTGGQSPDLEASMRLVRSYAARVKKMAPSPGPTPFNNFPPFQPSQGDSFIDRERVGSFRDRFLSPQGATFRDRGCSFRRERLRRRQPKDQSPSSPPPPVSRESREISPEPSRSILRAKYFPPQRAPSGNNVSLIPQDSPPARPKSYEILPSMRLASPPPRRASTGCVSTGVHGYPPAAASDAVKTVCPSVAAAASPASRHAAVPRRRRSATADLCAHRPPLAWPILDALPPAPSSKRFHVRGGARPSR